MTTLAGNEPTDATELRSLRAVASTFVSSGSPRLIAAVTAVALAFRFSLARWGLADVVVIIFTVALVGIVEWLVHRLLLHAPSESFRMTRLKTGVRHRQHHLEPTRVDVILLHPFDAAVFIVMLGLFTVAWSTPIAWILGAESSPTVMTALVATWASLGHYEWTHLLVHSRYRPRSSHYAKLARHHRLHHYRNEHYWLGVTSRLGDRLAATMPERAGIVELSATARSLDS